MFIHIYIHNGISIISESTVWVSACSCWQQKKHQRPAFLALCEGNPAIPSGFPSQSMRDGDNSSLAWSDRGFLSFTMTSSNGSIFRVTGLSAGNSPVTGEITPQRPVTRSFEVSLICAWINRWVNNREAGDLRGHRAHYYSIVIIAYFHAWQ